MYRLSRILPVLLLMTIVSFLAYPVYSAYGTLDKVVLSAPSPVDANQQVTVRATVSVRG